MAARLRRVIWTSQARLHVDEVAEFISRDSYTAAQRFIGDVLRTASSLELMSERGRIVPELNRPSTRELIQGNYRLIYDVGPDAVTILAFIHGARDLSQWAQENL